MILWEKWKKIMDEHGRSTAATGGLTMTHDAAGPSVASAGSASRWKPPEVRPSHAGFLFVRWEDAEDQEVCVSVGYWNGKDFCKVIPVDDQMSVYGDTFGEIGTVTGWMCLIYPSMD